MSTPSKGKPDEEARLREILSKKKLIQKQSRRKKSDDGTELDGGEEMPAETSVSTDKAPVSSHEPSSSVRPSSGVAAMKKLVLENLESSKKGVKVGNGASSGNKTVNGGSSRSRRRRRRNRHRGSRYEEPPAYLMDNRSYYGRDYREDPRRRHYQDIRSGGRWRSPPRASDRGIPRGRDGSHHDRRGTSRRRSPRGRSRSYSSRSDSRSYSSRGSASRGYSSPSRSRSRSSRSSTSYRSRRSSRSYSRSPGRKKRSRSVSPSRNSRDNPTELEKKRKRMEEEEEERKKSNDKLEEVEPPVDESTKDLRTIFVNHLVMKAEEHDIRRYFQRKILKGPKWCIRDVILLRDKRTGRHKGGAYVELADLSFVEKALTANGIVPDFQRFPITVKRSEAEKNEWGAGYVPPSVNGGGCAADSHPRPVQFTADGKRIESQKVYVGSIDTCVTQAQLYALFSQFGPLDKVLLQMDPTTGISKGFAFLSFRDPMDANLAIQTMSGQLLAGRPLKTGWANQQSSAAEVEEVRSDRFPDDANEKIRNVNTVLTQLTGSGLVTMLQQVDLAQQQAILAVGGGPAAALGILPKAQLQSVAEAALAMALGETPTVQGGQPSSHANISTVEIPCVDPFVIGRADNPSHHILVHHMFDKDEETEPGWETDIRLDFEDECAQYGKIVAVVVMSEEAGGKIYASFESSDDAMNCAKNLAGRWFDKRQLRVEFVSSIPV